MTGDGGDRGQSHAAGLALADSPLDEIRDVGAQPPAPSSPKKRAQQAAPYSKT